MTIHMKKADAQKWIAALRSGEYKQGTRYLAALDAERGLIRYCCLGVLQMALTGKVEVHDNGNPRGYPSIKWLQDKDIFFGDDTFNGEPAKTPILEISGEYRSAVDWNDSCSGTGGLGTFQNIADAIEREVEYTDEP